MIPLTGPGEKQVLQTGNLALQKDAALLPDASGVVFTAHEPGRGLRLFHVDLTRGKPRAISPEGYRGAFRGISPDGKLAVVSDSDQRRYLYPLAGG